MPLGKTSCRYADCFLVLHASGLITKTAIILRPQVLVIARTYIVLVTWFFPTFKVVMILIGIGSFNKQDLVLTHT